MDLPWDDFRLVKAVAEARSLAGAAAILKINPSTVFRRLGEAEAQLGTKLFERHRTGYVLTPAGEEMAALADQFDEAASTFKLKLAGRAIQPSGELRVTTNDTMLAHLLAPIFAKFRKSCPDVRLDVVLSNQALNLSKRDADVAIRATDNPPENLVGRRVATIAWAIYARRGIDAEHRLTLERAIEERDWISLGDSLGNAKAARFVRNQVPAERIALKLNTVLGLTEAVEADIGVGPLPCFIADPRPDLVRLSEPDPEFSTGLWLLTHPELRHSPRVRSFLDVVGDALVKLRPQLEGKLAG